jgi:MFS family permease
VSGPPQRVIGTYYAIAGLFTLSAALIWGVNTLFLLHAGLDILGVFIANAAFTAGMVVFEIPTGVMADTAGRRLSFLLSVAILSLTTVGYVLVARTGGGLAAFAAVSVAMGLGFTFYSGAVEAWLVDALKSTGFDRGLDQVFARGAMVTGAAMLTGTLAGGVLGTADLALPYVVRAGLLAAAFIVAFVAMRDLGFTPRAVRLRDVPREMRVVAAASLRYGWRQRPVRFVMWCSFLQMGFMYWGFYAWQPYFLELLGRDAVWAAGAAASVIAGAMIAGNALVDYASRFCGRRTTLLLWAAGLQAAAAVGVGLTHSFWGALALFVVLAAGIGIAGPVKQAYLHNSIPSTERASVVSFDSMFGNGGGIVGQAGLGYLSRAQSIEQGYVVGGLATTLALPLLLVVRRIGRAADVFVGERAGADSPCAAQGIPDIAQVDARGRGLAAPAEAPAP